MDARDEKATGTGAPPPIPFDRELLDALMERAGIDVLVGLFQAAGMVVLRVLARRASSTRTSIPAWSRARRDARGRTESEEERRSRWPFRRERP